MGRPKVPADQITIPGLNIQYPWSQLIVTGKKTVETRAYPIPLHLLNRELALIETPGRMGKKHGISSARIIAIITFSNCFQYGSKEQWLNDKHRHRVALDDSQYTYTTKGSRWGWEISKVSPLQKPQEGPKRKGIVFTRECSVCTGARD